MLKNYNIEQWYQNKNIKLKEKLFYKVDNSEL